MRCTLTSLFAVSALLAASSATGQTIGKATFNTGVGISVAFDTDEEEPFDQQTYAQLVEAGELEEFTLGVDLGGTNIESMLRFDNLFGDGPGQVPIGAHIVQSTLAVRTVGGGDGARVHRLLLPFEPATDTWANWGSGANGRNAIPGVDPDDVEAVAQFDYFQGPTVDGVTRMDVTSGVKAWQATGDATAANTANKGWFLDAIDTGGWDFNNFDIEEPNDRPKLTVTYTDVAPTVAAFQQNTNGYFGASDAYLSESAPDTNLGFDTDLVVGNVDAEGNRNISLLKFEDIVGDQAGQMPADAQLVRATLKLQLFQAGEGLELRRLGADWEADTVTWDNFATVGGVTLVRDAATVGVLEDQEGQFVEFDVTGGVRAWLDGVPNYGWALTALPSTAAETRFTAADFGDLAPILELTYIPGDGASVPEPASFWLLGIACVACAMRRHAGWRSLASGLLIMGAGASTVSAQTIQTATFNTGVAGMYNEAFPDLTFAQFQVEDDDPDLGDVSIDTGPLREAMLRFNGPIYGSGPGLVPIDGFIIRAEIALQTTSEGDGANLHRMLLPFDPATDTYNNWGSGLNGRNSLPGIQADGVEAVEAVDSTTGFQLEGFSSIDVTSSLQAWQAEGDADSANAANLGWYFQAIDDAGWDFSVFDGAVPPVLSVQYSNIPPTVISFQPGFDGYEGVTDTFIAESEPDASFGDSGDFSVGGLDDNSGQRIALVRFDDIIGDEAGQLPTDATLVRAELKLNATNGGDGLEIRQMLTDWSEGDSWNTLIDSTQMSLLTDDAIGEVDGTIVLDVTRSVQAWMDGDENLGWALSALIDSDGTVDFASSEASDNPPGDTNGDGAVDIVDLNNVRNNFGATEFESGDTNGDGQIDIQDLNAVRNNFGAMGGNASALRPELVLTYLPGGGAAAVPEPGSWALLAIGALAGIVLRRRRG